MIVSARSGVDGLKRYECIVAMHMDDEFNVPSDQERFRGALSVPEPRHTWGMGAVRIRPSTLR